MENATVGAPRKLSLTELIDELEKVVSETKEFSFMLENKLTPVCIFAENGVGEKEELKELQANRPDDRVTDATNKLRKINTVLNSLLNRINI